MVDSQARIIKIPWYRDFKMRAVVVFLLPAMVILLVFLVIPSIFAIAMSFTKWDMLSPAKFNGLANYKKLFVDERFKASFINTLYFTMVSVPLCVVFSLVISLTLSQAWVRGRDAFRIMFFLPTVVSPVAISMIWMWIYNPAYGLLNSFISIFGIPRQFWVSDPKLAIPSLILMSIWQTFGYNVVIFLAGLTVIPKEYYEAARVDGANKMQCIRRITLPLLLPTTVFVIVMAIIKSFQVFDQVLVLGGASGPPKSLLVAVYYLYQMGFGSLKMGYSSCIGIALFLTILLFAIIQFKYYMKKIR